MTDLELIGLFRQAYEEGGDSRLQDAAWREFIAAQGRNLDFTVRRWCRHGQHAHAAEDLIQDVYARLQKDRCRAIREFVPGRAMMSTWIRTIAINVCRSYVRSGEIKTNGQQVRPSPFSTGGSSSDGPIYIDPTNLVDQEIENVQDAFEKIRLLSECISSLDDTKRLFFITRLLGMLTFDNGLSITEIGRIHKSGPQSAKYRLDTAEEMLARCLRGKIRGKARSLP